MSDVPPMTPDEMEAGAWRYGPTIIMILPLRSGRFAVFNSARDLCGIVERIEDAPRVWHSHKDEPLDLKELGLL